MFAVLLMDVLSHAATKIQEKIARNLVCQLAGDFVCEVSPCVSSLLQQSKDMHGLCQLTFALWELRLAL